MDAQQYTPPPMRKQLFCLLDKATLENAGWSFFDDLDGDISAPSALPSGGVAADGMFGPHTCFVPREWEAHQKVLRMLRLVGSCREPSKHS